LHYAKSEFTAAEAEYKEALAIRRELAEVSPLGYMTEVATTLNNLAALQKDKNEFAAAEAAYREALAIRRRLAEANPQAYLPDVAIGNTTLAHAMPIISSPLGSR
jgi:tetratricopeptide (TPR) repeat protein